VKKNGVIVGKARKRYEMRGKGKCRGGRDLLEKKGCASTRGRGEVKMYEVLFPDTRGD